MNGQILVMMSCNFAYACENDNIPKDFFANK